MGVQKVIKSGIRYVSGIQQNNAHIDLLNQLCFLLEGVKLLRKRILLYESAAGGGEKVIGKRSTRMPTSDSFWFYCQPSEHKAMKQIQENDTYLCDFWNKI